MDDANFGQKWWRQKWKKDHGSSRAVTGGTGVNGLKCNNKWNEVDFNCENTDGNGDVIIAVVIAIPSFNPKQIEAQKIFWS